MADLKVSSRRGAFGFARSFHGPAWRMVKLPVGARDKHGDLITEYTPEWARIGYEKVSEGVTLMNARESGHEYEGRVKIGGKTYSAFTDGGTNPDGGQGMIIVRGGSRQASGQKPRSRPSASRHEAGGNPRVSRASAPVTTLRTGDVIENIERPDWGTWRVTGMERGYWSIANARGERLLEPSEVTDYRQWRLVSRPSASRHERGENPRTSGGVREAYTSKQDPTYALYDNVFRSGAQIGRVSGPFGGRGSSEYFNWSVSGVSAAAHPPFGLSGGSGSAASRSRALGALIRFDQRRLARASSSSPSASRHERGENPRTSLDPVTAASTLDRLYRKHVGSGTIDAARLRAVLSRDVAAGKSGAVRMTPGALRELRADRALAGRIAKLVGKK